MTNEWLKKSVSVTGAALIYTYFSSDVLILFLPLRFTFLLFFLSRNEAAATKQRKPHQNSCKCVTIHSILLNMNKIRFGASLWLIFSTDFKFSGMSLAHKHFGPSTIVAQRIGMKVYTKTICVAVRFTFLLSLIMRNKSSNQRINVKHAIASNTEPI